MRGGQARRLALETRVLDGRANGEWRVRSLADFQDMYMGNITGKAGELAGETFQRGGRSASIFCLAVSVPHTYPRGDGGPRLGGKVATGGAGLTGCDGRIDERRREECFFASLSPPFSGKTKFTRELD
jgi:hypothetical protein